MFISSFEEICGLTPKDEIFGTSEFLTFEKEILHLPSSPAIDKDSIFELNDVKIPTVSEFYEEVNISEKTTSQRGKVQSLKCTVCHKMFHQKFKLLKHFKKFHMPGKQNRPKLDLKCELCPSVLSRAYELKRHNLRMHSICTDCSNSFDSKQESLDHIKNCATKPEKIVSVDKDETSSADSKQGTLIDQSTAGNELCLSSDDQMTQVNFSSEGKKLIESIESTFKTIQVFFGNPNQEIPNQGNSKQVDEEAVSIQSTRRESDLIEFSEVEAKPSESEETTNVSDETLSKTSPVPCKLCDSTFNNPTELITHLYTHMEKM